MNILKYIREYISNKPKVKKILGIILISVGFISLITPPHSRLMVSNYRSRIIRYTDVIF